MRYQLNVRVKTLFVGLCALLPAFARADEATDAALEQARLTGKPILAVAGREACPLCQALKRRLSSEAALQPLLAEFVPLQLNIDAAPGQEWAQKFPVSGNTLPFIYIIRADGEKLYAESGTPEGPALPQLLSSTRQQAGTEMTAKQAEKLKTALAAANQAMADGNTAAAVAAIVPAAVKGSFAQPAVDAAKLIETLTEQGKAAITAAEGKLASEETALEGAVELVEVMRVYKKLPDVFKAANEAKRSHKEAAVKLAFTQAAMIDKGRALEAQKQTPRAIEAYKAVAKKYPDTPAAEFVQERIDALQGNGQEQVTPNSEEAATDEPKPTAGP
jgi:tetratricopeptide (TPR) repeat protein